MVATGLGTDFFQKISFSLTGFLCLVAQSCPSLCEPIKCSPAHQAPLSLGISQARNTGEGCLALLQGIFPIQELN